MTRTISKKIKILKACLFFQLIRYSIKATIQLDLTDNQLIAIVFGVVLEDLGIDPLSFYDSEDKTKSIKNHLEVLNGFAFHTEDAVKKAVASIEKPTETQIELINKILTQKNDITQENELFIASGIVSAGKIKARKLPKKELTKVVKMHGLKKDLSLVIDDKAGGLSNTQIELLAREYKTKQNVLYRENEVGESRIIPTTMKGTKPYNDKIYARVQRNHDVIKKLSRHELALTLTYKDCGAENGIIDKYKQISKDISKVLNRLRISHDVYAQFAIESQKNGNPHIHALLYFINDPNFKKPINKLNSVECIKFIKEYFDKYMNYCSVYVEKAKTNAWLSYVFKNLKVDITKLADKLEKKQALTNNEKSVIMTQYFSTLAGINSNRGLRLQENFLNRYNLDREEIPEDDDYDENHKLLEKYIDECMEVGKTDIKLYWALKMCLQWNFPYLKQKTYIIKGNKFKRLESGRYTPVAGYGNLKNSKSIEESYLQEGSRIMITDCYNSALESIENELKRNAELKIPTFEDYR